MADLLSSTNTYGDTLRGWRKRRRFSQLTLSLHAGISSRHLSFLESGRAGPSQAMVLKLAESLEMPKREINQALLLAGFAPVYKERPESDADLAPVHTAISVLLRNHMPYPALVMDRHWNITSANQAAISLLGATGFAGHVNMLAALTAQTPAESSIINWAESVATVLLRLRAELLIIGSDPVLSDMLCKLQKHYKQFAGGDVIDRSQAILPTQFQIDDEIISTFSTITQFGTVQDIVLDDLRVELMFPLDAVSEQYFREAGET